MKVKALKKKRKSSISPLKITKTEHKSFWIKLLGDVYYQKLREMNNSNIAIIKWQKQRLKKSLIFILVGLLMYLFLGKEWYYLAGGIATSVGFYVWQA